MYAPLTLDIKHPSSIYAPLTLDIKHTCRFVPTCRSLWADSGNRCDCITCKGSCRPKANNTQLRLWHCVLLGRALRMRAGALGWTRVLACDGKSTLVPFCAEKK